MAEKPLGMRNPGGYWADLMLEKHVLGQKEFLQRSEFLVSGVIGVEVG